MDIYHSYVITVNHTAFKCYNVLIIYFVCVGLMVHITSALE